MNKNFALLLAALLPLSGACLDHVDIADRSDGGAADVPATDAPPMDAPPAVCAACGGPDSPSCLYAPGCGSPQRVCAPNTCADAVAIPFCGCDGQTRYRGCITPDEPFLHTGPCAPASDGGPDAPDGGPVVPPDVPADVPALGFCPAEVDQNTAQNPTFRYRRAAFALPPGASAPPDGGVTPSPDAGTSIDVTGTWVGTRLLAAPIAVGCDAADTRPSCLADTVIQVQSDGGALRELVVTTPAGELAALTPGTAVTLRATASRWDGVTPFSYAAELVVRRVSDGALMLAIVTARPGDTAPDLGVAVARAEAVCRSRPEPLCARVLQAYSLRFGEGTGARTVSPEGSAVLEQGVRLLCRNRNTYQRVPGGGVECADLTPSVTSFEIVRQP